MSGLGIGYARVSTTGQDLTAQRNALSALGVEPARVYVDLGLTTMRTRGGLAVARAAGRLRGRKAELTPRQEAHLVELHRAGDKTATDLAELVGVGRSTVHRAFERASA